MIDENALGNSRSSVGTYHKQSPIAPKKLALRDVQNDNRNYVSKEDAIKVSGVKRIVPDTPSSPPRRFPSSSTCANEGPNYNAGGKSELELSKQTIQESADRSADFHQSRQQFGKQTGTPQRQSQKVENYKSSALKPMTSQYSNLSIISEVCHSGEPQGSSDEQRMERFLRLQKFLKQCDETDPKEYIQMMLYLSPTELSRHAIELEYRSIQLSIEEGKEIQRTRGLNILEKSSVITKNE